MPKTRFSEAKARLEQNKEETTASTSAVLASATIDSAAGSSKSATSSNEKLPIRSGTNSKRKRILSWEREARAPRPSNAFITFKSALRDGPHKKEYAERLSRGENIGVIAQQIWKTISPEEKSAWYSTARRTKAEHALKYPDYKFQPRRRSDKKGSDKSKSPANEEDNTSVAPVGETVASHSTNSEDGDLDSFGIARFVEVYPRVCDESEYEPLYRQGWKASTTLYPLVALLTRHLVGTHS
jgi:hypothetical protein